MSIFLQSVDVRHERRIRLTFTNHLAVGAFGNPAPSLYTLEAVDGSASNPSVVSAYVVVGSSTVVELALSIPLVAGVEYAVYAEGVPATDASTTAPDSMLGFRWGIPVKKPNRDVSGSDRTRLAYYVDLLWVGGDFQEDATGDLDCVDGPANVTKALNNRMEMNPGELMWHVSYGVGIRQHVDSPSDVSGTLKGKASSQVLSDPRVKSLKVEHEIADEKTYLYLKPTLVSGQSIERVSIEVPNDS